MRKKVIRAAALTLMLVFLPALLLFTGASLPRLYGESYYAELKPLTDRIYDAGEKKIVLIGGSNIAFGIDVDLMEELLEEKGYSYTVCPYGLYAAIGTGAMLSLSQGGLGEGDLVILAMEPTSETMSTYFGADAFLKSAEEAPELLLRLNGKQRGAVLGNYIGYLQERISIVKSEDLPSAEGVYRRDSFGENGNLDYDREGNLMILGFDTTETVNLNVLQIEEDFSEQVRNYAGKAKRKGAEVLLSFSPVNSSALDDSSEETMRNYFTLCQETFGCPVISDPNRYVMDSGWFYDSNFHLNTAGAQVRTVRLAEDILAYLGCAEPVEYELPEEPAPISQSDEQQAGADIPGADQSNNADVSDFVFESTAEDAAWKVVGVSAEGKARTVLTLPENYEGKPVIGFEAGAFDEAALLEELRLPESIEMIPDSAFAGCPSLKRLVLYHTDEPCGVSEHSFDGADDLRIYVPEEVYSMYRDGTGCETNDWIRWLDRIDTF